jgi:hypothetical protein
MKCKGRSKADQEPTTGIVCGCTGVELNGFEALHQSMVGERSMPDIAAFRDCFVSSGQQ